MARVCSIRVFAVCFRFTRLLFNTGIALCVYIFLLHIHQVQLQSEELGKHLSEVETLLQQHNMLGTSLEAYKQHITQVNQQAGLYADKKYANSNEKCEYMLCTLYY